MTVNLRQMTFFCTAKDNFLIHHTIKKEVARLEREGVIQNEDEERTFIDECSKIVNLGRLSSRYFDYYAVNNLIKLKNFIIFKRHAGRKMLDQTVVEIPADYARRFLEIYKSNYKTKSIFLRRLKRLQINEQKIMQLEKEMQVLRDDISKIEASSDSELITITFPPQVNLSKLKSEHQSLIKEFGAQKVKKQLESFDAITQKINKCLIICASRFNYDDNHSLILTGLDNNANILQAFVDACLDNMHLFRQGKLGTRSRLRVCHNIEGLLRAHHAGEIDLKESDVDTLSQFRISLAVRPVTPRDPAIILKHGKQSLGITKNDLILLNLIDKFESYFELDESEKQSLANLLALNIGDIGFKKRLSHFKKLLGNSSHTSSVEYFLYKTHHIKDKMDYVLKRANLIIRGHIRDKLTISEIGILNDMMKLYKKFYRLEEQSIVEKNPKLKSLFNKLRQANQLLEFIQTQAGIDSVLKDGDLMMTQIDRSSSLKNKNPDQEGLLTQSFVSKYGHAACVYKDEQNNPCLSHIYGSHEAGRINLSDMVVATVFRLNPHKLMPASKQNRVSESEVQKIFEGKFRELQINNQSLFADIKNDKKMRFKAGLSGFGMYGGHQRSTPNHFAYVNARLQNSKCKIKNKMICSEFVARCLISALFKTNNELKKQFRTKEDFIQIPFAYEKIQRIHPQRLISLLHETGALENIQVGGYLESIIDFQSPKFVKHHPEYLPKNVLKKTLMMLARRHDIDTFIVKGIDACETYSRMEGFSVDFQDPSMIEKLSGLLSYYYEHPHPETFFDQFLSFIKSIFGYGQQANISFQEIKNTLEKKPGRA